MNEALKASPDVKPTVFDKTPESWEKFGTQLGEIATEAFKEYGFSISDPVLGEKDEDIAYADFNDAILHPTTTVVILTSENDPSKLIGFTLSMPIGKMNPAREAENANTSYLYWTAVDSNEQRKGNAFIATTALMRELVGKGGKYIERDVVKAGSYDDKVKKQFENFPTAVLEQYEHERFPDAGVETFFRIDMVEYFRQLDSAK